MPTRPRAGGVYPVELAGVLCAMALLSTACLDKRLGIPPPGTGDAQDWSGSGELTGDLSDLANWEARNEVPESVGDLADLTPEVVDLDSAGQTDGDSAVAPDALNDIDILQDADAAEDLDGLAEAEGMTDAELHDGLDFIDSDSGEVELIPDLQPDDGLPPDSLVDADALSDTPDLPPDTSLPDAPDDTPLLPDADAAPDADVPVDADLLSDVPGDLSDVPSPDVPDIVCDGTCGDGSCATQCGENPLLCPADCCGLSACGDGLCAKGCAENMATCPQDCCVGACGDSVCSKECSETVTTCPHDCCSLSGCGNGKCQRTGSCPEDGENCPADCCLCGDTYCEPACGEKEPGPGFCAADC